MTCLRLTIAILFFIVSFEFSKAQKVYKNTCNFGVENGLNLYLIFNDDSTFFLLDEENEFYFFGNYIKQDSSYILIPDCYVHCDSVKKGFFNEHFVFLDIKIPYLDMGNQSRVRVGKQDYKKNADGIYVLPKDSLNTEFVGIGGYELFLYLDQSHVSDYYYYQMKNDKIVSRGCLSFKTQVCFISAQELILSAADLGNLSSIYFANLQYNLVFTKLKKGEFYPSIVR
jgi:hypothetical protein